MSRKAIHVTVNLPLKSRWRLFWSDGTINLLFQPTVSGVKLVDVIVAGKSAAREEAHGHAD